MTVEKRKWIFLLQVYGEGKVAVVTVMAVTVANKKCPKKRCPKKKCPKK